MQNNQLSNSNNSSLTIKFQSFHTYTKNVSGVSSRSLILWVCGEALFSAFCTRRSDAAKGSSVVTPLGFEANGSSAKGSESMSFEVAKGSLLVAVAVNGSAV